MKTAVSIPDPLFNAADQHARRQRLSRSELYARALARYLADESDDAVTDALNEVYGEADSSLDPAIAAGQRGALRG